jgi:transposase
MTAMSGRCAIYLVSSFGRRWWWSYIGCAVRWLLLTSWLNLDRGKRRQLNTLFAVNRRILKAYLLKESLSHFWDYSYEGAMLRYLQKWIDQLRWQRLKPMETLAQMLLDHLEVSRVF